MDNVIDKIAKDNSAAIEELVASKFFIDVPQNIIPTKGLEKGMPIVWGNKTMPTTLLPDRDDRSGYSCGVCT